jgi:hypothetical protein
MMRGVILAAASIAMLTGCAPDPEPLGPDATPQELAEACDAMDLDACSRAAQLRSQQYQDAMTIN